MSFKDLINKMEESFRFENEFFGSLVPNAFLYTHDLIGEIVISRKEQKAGKLETLMNFASIDGLDNRYTSVLCELILENWHHSREDIAMMLKYIKDEKSIKYLYESALDIPDYDDGRSLAKKCIWALGAIATDEAKDKLLLLAGSDDPIINEVANMELN